MKIEKLACHIGAEISGIFSRIVLVSWVETSASAGITAERRGSRSTSSNVIPSNTILAAERVEVPIG